MSFKKTASSDWADYLSFRKSRISKDGQVYFTCPHCGQDETDVTNMKNNGYDDNDGHYYEVWKCGSCGKSVVLDYEGEDDSGSYEFGEGE